MNNQVINVSRGEIVFSQNNFAKRNGMSRQKLRTFLKKLEKTNAYPKKIGKKKVEDKFNAIEFPIDKILKNIELQKQSDQWQTQQYIPNPETYLNQERWQDEVILEVKPDEPIYIYECKICNKVKDKSPYRDMYISCCDEQTQPRKEYK